MRETLGKPKENEGSHEAPMCFRRGVLIAMWKLMIAGQGFPKIIKNIVKPILSDDTRFTANPVRSSGVPSAKRDACGTRNRMDDIRAPFPKNRSKTL